jgi:flagellar basal body rod protein FlgG
MQKGITLQSSGSYDRTGTRTQADQELQMKGAGTRRGSHQLGLDGNLVSAQGNESGDMTITVPTVGQTVPVKQSGSYSITSSAPR